MKLDVTKEVTGKWHTTLMAMGIPEEVLNGKSQPCPMCGGKDRFRFTDYENAGLYICNGCGNGNGWTLAQRYFDINFATAAKQIRSILGLSQGGMVDNPKFDPVPALKRVAGLTTRINNELSVAKYLLSRGFEDFPDGLRQARIPFYKNMKKAGEYDALVSLVQDWEGNGITYHLTYIEDGKKANIDPSRKLMPGKGTISGAAIRLHTDFEDKICIAEGVESAYAAHLDSGLPAFAAMNANCLENFVPPDKVTQVWIYADNDRNYTGQAAAYKLAKRLMIKGVEAWVFVPDRVGQDMNDVLLSK
jgi:putative DNA primase/helicase